jgi:hypothetical protein
VFAIAQASKFKIYFENQNFLTLCVRLLLGLRTESVTVEKAVELFQLN